MTILGVEGARNTTLNLSGTASGFNIDGGGPVNLSGLTITGGAGANPPVYVNGPEVSVTGLSIQGNSTTASGARGGGLRIDAGSLSVTRSAIIDNIAMGTTFAQGGGLYELGGTVVVDTSTVGVAASREIAGRCAHDGVAYVDAPVSGGVAGARARTLAVMYAADDDACAHVEPVLAGLSDCRYRVGDQPGLGQAMKLANNFLSATALIATSEAVAFGVGEGLDMAVMLEVLNGSSGRSAATGDKFPNHVLTGRYASGFTNSLMAKDVQLYLRAVTDQDGPATVGAVTAAVWDAFATRDPGVDFTRIYPFVSLQEER